MFRFIVATIMMVLLISCGATSNKGLMPELINCDSAVVMYYHTPGDPRFFNMTKVKNMDSLSGIIKNVNSKPIEAKDSCITQGKIYFYGKGEAVYPVYFSRKEECMTFSFIITGKKYFSSMSKYSRDILNELEKRVKVFEGRKE